MNDHPQNLSEYVSGQLGEAETKRILEHLVECDLCLAEVDRQWGGRSQTDASAPPEIEPARQNELESRVLKQLHIADLANQFIRLSGWGLFSVFMAMLRPFLSGNRARLKPKE